MSKRYARDWHHAQQDSQFKSTLKTFDWKWLELRAVGKKAMSVHVKSFHRLLCPWILQARILEWVAFSRGSFWSRDSTLSPMSLALAGRFFTTSSTWEGWVRKLQESKWDTRVVSPEEGASYMLQIVCGR